MNSASRGSTTHLRGSFPDGRSRKMPKKRSAVALVRFPPSNVIVVVALGNPQLADAVLVLDGERDHQPSSCTSPRPMKNNPAALSSPTVNLRPRRAI